MTLPKHFFNKTNTQKVFIPTTDKEAISSYKYLKQTPYDKFYANPSCNTAILTGYINKIVVIDVD